MSISIGLGIWLHTSATSNVYWYASSTLLVDNALPTLITEPRNNRYSVNTREKTFAEVHTFTRSTIGTYNDFEGIIRTADVDEPRHQGMRVVKNEIPVASQGFGTWNLNSAAVRTGGQLDSQGGSNAYKIETDASAPSGIFHSGLGTIGKTQIYTMWIRGETGGEVLRIGDEGSTNIITLTIGWQRLENPSHATVSGTLIIYNNAAVAQTFYIYQPMLETSTGQANQNPSSFVEDIGVYIYENGNTVAADVVTEAQGALIPYATRKGVLNEDGATNLEPNSEDGLNSTITVVLGDNTISMTGAGSLAITANTAGGTGWASATDGSSVTVNITTAGTINLTVTGAVDTKQVETGANATSYIPTAGGVVLRAADNIKIDGAVFASFWNALKGTLYMEQEVFFQKDYYVVASASNGTSSERFKLQINTAGIVNLEVKDGGVTQVGVNAGATIVGISNKEAYAYELNNTNVASGGTVGTTDTTCTIPTVDRLEIMNQLGALQLNGYYQGARYYPIRGLNASIGLLTAPSIGELYDTIELYNTMELHS